MKKINWILLLFILTLPTMAQQKKSFTLEDLLPGGSTWHALQPKNMWTTWWGNQCVETEIEACQTINPKTGKKKELFTLEELNSWLCPTDSTKKTIHHCYNLTFPYANQPLVLVRTVDTRYLVNFEEGKVVWQQAQQPKGSHTDWNANSRNLAYVYNHNLYVTTAEGNTVAVSNDGSNDLVYGQSVHRDEFGIHKGTFWSPDGKLLAFYRMDQSMVPDYPQVDISTRIATTFSCKYPMAGETSHKVTVGIFNTADQKTTWLAADACYLTNISWSAEGKYVYIFELNRDQNHMQLVQYDAATGVRNKVVYEERHPKYVEPMHGLTFLPWDANKAIMQSQRDGYNHLYLIDFSTEQEGGEQTLPNGSSFKEYAHIQQITSGKWVTLNVHGFNIKDRSLIISSNELNPIQTNLFSVKIATGKRSLLGANEGVHRATLSADGTYVLDTYSTPKTVARSINLLSTKSGKGINLLTAANPWDEFNVPEISGGTIKAADGVTDLYYRMIKPTDFDPNKKYPAIVYVYGGPHAHLVDASRNYMVRGWEIYMAQKGYVIFVVDGRGSQHRGTEFENVTFRQLGVEEMKDQLKGVEFLKSHPFVDANRLGVHGWSFGGFMTTNLMTTYPDVFKVGVAGGPVIDWQYYEVMYGERYMDTPQSNPEGYKGSNLRLKAKNLKGKLQIITGYNDPVCVPQHSFSFLRACIDAGTQVDFFAYPGGEHNMVGRDQVHLHQRITQYFEDYLK